jgi:hypothetical protein
MNTRILQVNYRCSLSRQEFEETIGASASELSGFPGLQWKIWVVNEELGQYGGIHLFDDRSSVDAYLRQVIEGLKGHPAMSDVTTKIFEVMETPSLATRAPVKDGVRI